MKKYQLTVVILGMVIITDAMCGGGRDNVPGFQILPAHRQKDTPRSGNDPWGGFAGDQFTQLGAVN